MSNRYLLKAGMYYFDFSKDNVDDYNDLGPMHSLHVLQQTLLVVNYQHVTQVTPHSVGLLLDGLGLGLDPENQSEVSLLRPIRGQYYLV